MSSASDKQQQTIQKVIVLSGVANIGKTRTLLKLVWLMCHRGWRICLTSQPSPGPSTFSVPSIHLVTGFDGGFCLTKDGKPRVGICTAGDTSDIIDGGFDFFRDNNCETCFIATRTSGQTILAVEQQTVPHGVTPFYTFLHWCAARWNPAAPRTWDQQQSDVAHQLYDLI